MPSKCRSWYGYHANKYSIKSSGGVQKWYAEVVIICPADLVGFSDGYLDEISASSVQLVKFSNIKGAALILPSESVRSPCGACAPMVCKCCIPAAFKIVSVTSVSRDDNRQFNPTEITG